jgi:hypothetical protein
MSGPGVGCGAALAAAPLRAGSEEGVAPAEGGPPVPGAVAPRVSRANCPPLLDPAPCRFGFLFRPPNMPMCGHVFRVGVRVGLWVFSNGVACPGAPVGVGLVEAGVDGGVGGGFEGGEVFDADAVGGVELGDVFF